MKEKFVPLKIWWWALGIATLIVISSGFGYKKKHQQAEEKLRREKIREFFKLNIQKLVKQHKNGLNKEDEVIILLGSSLTGNGVDESAFITTDLKSKNLKVYKVWHQGMYFNDLNSKELFDQLKELNPKLICIEDQVIFYEDRYQMPEYNILNRYYKSISRIGRKLSRKDEESVAKEIKIPQSRRFDYLNSKHYRTISHQDSINYKENLLYRGIRSFRATPILNEELAKLNKEGVHIVSLHLPRPGEVEKVFLSKPEFTKRGLLHEKYKESTGMEYWHFPYSLPFEYYRDIPHLNYKGQAFYSNWLHQKINTHFSKHGTS